MSSAVSTPVGRKEYTTFQVVVPTLGPNSAAATDVTLTINRHGIIPADLFARIRANMEVHDNVPLGWRLSTEAKKDVHRLQTLDDMQLAIDTILKKLDAPQRRNEVQLKIMDTREKKKVQCIMSRQCSEG